LCVAPALLRLRVKADGRTSKAKIVWLGAHRLSHRKMTLITYP
jgi:hypothetical protein